MLQLELCACQRRLESLWCDGVCARVCARILFIILRSREHICDSPTLPPPPNKNTQTTTNCAVLT